MDSGDHDRGTHMGVPGRIDRGAYHPPSSRGLDDTDGDDMDSNEDDGAYSSGSDSDGHSESLSDDYQDRATGLASRPPLARRAANDDEVEELDSSSPSQCESPPPLALANDTAGQYAADDSSSGDDDDHGYGHHGRVEEGAGDGEADDRGGAGDDAAVPLRVDVTYAGETATLFDRRDPDDMRAQAACLDDMYDFVNCIRERFGISHTDHIMVVLNYLNISLPEMGNFYNETPRRINQYYRLSGHDAVDLLIECDESQMQLSELRREAKDCFQGEGAMVSTSGGVETGDGLLDTDGEEEIHDEPTPPAVREQRRQKRIYSDLMDSDDEETEKNARRYISQLSRKSM